MIQRMILDSPHHLLTVLATLALLTAPACDSTLEGSTADASWDGDTQDAPHDSTTVPDSPEQDAALQDATAPADGPVVTPDGSAPSKCAHIMPPPGAVSISPGTEIQTVVDAHQAGTAYLLQAGVHRMQNVEPKQGDVFYGELDPTCKRLTTLNGSRLLTNWSQSGSRWVHTGQTQQGQVHGDCESDWPRCMYPEDLFVDDQPLKHVESIGQVGPGTWFFDYDQDTVHLGEDPSGHTVEIGVTRAAFSPSASHVQIYGLIVEKYAIPPQMGAIGDQYPESDWHIEWCEVRLNHGTGIHISHRGKAINNHIHHNGQKGIGAGGDDGLIEGNEIAYNNFAHIASGWEAGGSKFANTNRLVVRGNCVHHNGGPGLWTDINNMDTLYEKNVVFANDKEGIFHEISYDAVIRDNLVGNNAPEGVGWLYGSNILISTSKNVQVTGNIVEVSAAYGNGIGIIWQDRGSDWASTGNTVTGNDVTFLGSSGEQGAAADFSPATTEIFLHNTFDNNTYHMTDLSDQHFAWDNGSRDFAAFQSAGQDVNGTADTNVQARTWSCSMQP